MKHLESIIFAAFVGGALAWFLNESILKFSDDPTTALKAGASIGAATQVVMRITGVS